MAAPGITMRGCALALLVAVWLLTDQALAPSPRTRSRSRSRRPFTPHQGHVSAWPPPPFAPRANAAPLSFLRGDVERPPSNSRRAPPSGSGPEFGSRALPLRDAVERAPPQVASFRSSHRIPLRDAVESRPGPPSPAEWRYVAPPDLPHAAPPAPGAAPGLRPSLHPGLSPSLHPGLSPGLQHPSFQHEQDLDQDSGSPPRHTTNQEGIQVVCFVEGWSAYRMEPARFSARHVDPHACTHLVYAFASLHPHDLTLIPQDEDYDVVKGGYRSLVGLKRINPHLKVLISVGGYAEARRRFATMAASAASRREFIRSALHFLERHGFDGVDLDWEFPAAADLGGKPAEREHFSLLVEEMGAAFAPRGWLLTASVPPSRFRVEDGFDVPRLSRHLHLLFLMAFDLHAERDAAADHHAPLTQRRHDKGLGVFFNVDYAVRYWVKKGAPREKLIVGVPFYGRSFTLASPAEAAPGSPVRGPGTEGPYTQQQGFLSFMEILQLQEEGGWVIDYDDAGSPFMVKGDQWVGYDNPLSLSTKMSYIARNRLGGAMVWALDLDDFRGLYGESWPLLNAVRASLQAASEPGFGVPPASPSPPPQLPAPPPPSAPQPVLVDSHASNCTGRGLSRDPDNCGLYYRCEWGMRHTYTCPEGLYFDPALGQCTWPQLVDCPHGAPADLPRRCPATGVLPDPGDCNAYVVCARGRAPERRICAKDHVFDARASRCVRDGRGVSCRTRAAPYGPLPALAAPLRQQPPTHQYAVRQAVDEEDFKVVCYFTNWAWYRPDGAKFAPEHVDTRLCTHVVYAYASLDPETLAPVAFDPRLDIDYNFYQRLTSLPGPRPRQRGSPLTVLLGLGGWTDSAGDKYSRLVSDGAARRNFVAQTVAFLRRHKFKGLHLDWHYPRCWQSNCAKGPTSDRANFAKLIQELSSEFQRQDPPLVLAVAISGYKEVIDEAYDLPSLGRNLDFMSVMTYDYHGSWEKRTGHVSPLYYRTGDSYPLYNTNATLDYLVSKGAPRNKLLMGIPFYGQSYRLSDPNSNDIGAPASGPGEAGQYTHQPGMLGYFEICEKIRKDRWTVKRDPYGATGPYAYKDDQWVGFEDVDSVKEKAKYIRNMGYGGAMAWTMDLDDFRNMCCREPFPLLRAINRVLGRLPDGDPPPGDCSTPPEPPTPAPPAAPTTDDGSGGEPSATTSWTTTTRPTTQWTTPSTTRTTTTPTTTTTTTTTTRPPWQPPSTTTRPPWQPPSTTTRPPWEQPSTTTRPPWEQPSTTTRPPWQPPSTTTQNPWQPPSSPSTTTSSPGGGGGPIAGQRCEAGSYAADPDNCQAYYRCILGEWRREFCAGGLHWNAKAGICDWPSEAKCSKDHPTQMGEISTPSTTWRPPTSTTQSSSRPPWWWSTTTTPTTTPNEWWTPSTTPATTTSEWWPTTPSTSTAPPGSSPDGPNEQCVSGQYYPDHGNCHHFYVCVNGALVKQSCAPGLVWNQDKNMCDWEFNVPCMDRSHAALRRAHVDDPCTDGPLAGYPGDCTKYLYCQWGMYKEGKCGPGLNWNSEGKICDWPSNAHCDEGSEGGGSTSTTHRPPGTTRPPSTTYTPPWTTSTSRPTSTTRPTTPGGPEPGGPDLSGYFKVVCYFTNWAWYRPGAGKYVPEDINADLCTHIIYGFAVLDYENLVIKAHDSWADFDNRFYERVVALKKKGKKVSLAIGGWNDSAGDKYSRLVNSPSARRRFIHHVLDFLEKYNFDGLDLDWEYPVCWQVDCKKGPPTDKQAFGDFVRELRAAFKPRGLLLSAAVSPSKTVVDAGYDVPALGDSLDWVAVMTYDYHGQWDKKTGHVAPMYFHPDDDFHFFNANYSINYWIQEGVPRRKIVMGMPMYGQSFQLAQAAVNGLNAAAPGPGQAGPFTRAAGFLAYYEICDRVLNQGWTLVQDSQRRMGPYAFKGNQWVGFDDIDMIELKSQYIRQNDLGGGMIWALDLDDFRGNCGQGKHPLLNTIRRVLADPPGPGDTTSVRPTTPSTTTTRPGGGAGGGGDGGTRPPYPPTVVPTTTSRPGPGTGTSTPRPGDTGEYKMVCYFTNWAWYRQGPGKYLPSDIDPELCTHIVYGFAVLNGDQLIIKPHDSWADIDNKFYEKVVEYKKYGIKVLIAIGGWNDSAGDKYSRLANNPSARSRFIKTVIDFIEMYGFDGLDLDWEYPVCWQVDCKKGPPSDKAGFADLVRELKAAFRPKGLLLSSAVSPSKAVIDAGYDVPTLSQNLDWIAVMTYDYHGQWDKKTGHVAPMYVHPEDWDTTFNSNFTIHYWIEKGADPRKLVMGMPMYGQSFSLADNLEHGLNSPTYGGGEAGDQTRARGFLAYYEICERIKNRGWKVMRDTKGRIGPYAYSRDQWVSFDDVAQIRMKSGFVKRMGLGGAMIWALDLDDFRNLCDCEPHPLLRTINRVLRGYPRATVDCTIRATETGSLHDPKPDDNRVHPTAISVKPTEGPVHSDGSSAGTCSGSQIFLPHPADCNKYYLCQYGHLLEQSCPPGLKWNQDHCDWPENTDCSAKPTVLPPTVTPSTHYPPVMTTTTEIMPKPPTPPPQPPIVGDSSYKVVCYFTNWAWYRQGAGKYLPADIDISLCTHVAYGFAVLDGSTLTIKPHDSWADIDNEFYHKLTDLKQRGVKVVIAIGGWNDSAGDKYSRLVNNPSARAKFITNVVEFIRKYDFDGLDLDWEYPVCWQVDCSKGPPTDKEGFSALVRELSAAFKPKGLLLSSAVSPSKAVIDAGYDVPTMSRYMDWIAVMTYDFHGHWDKQTGHVAPLFYYPGDTYDYFNSNYSIHYWLEKGADRKKIVMGMPMYGQSFSLADAKEHGLNAKSYGPGEAGEFTRAGGFMAYYEICYNVKNRGWMPVRDPEGRIGPYAYRGNQWVSYDDVEDIRRKSRFIKSLDLGGGMIWALDLDDFRNRCGCGTYPLLRTINNELRGISAQTHDCT